MRSATKANDSVEVRELRVSSSTTIIMISRATTTYNNNKRCLCSSFVSFDTLLSHKKHPNFLRIVQRRKEVFTVHTNQLLLLLWYSRSFRQQSVLVYTMQPKLHILKFIFYAFKPKRSFLSHAVMKNWTKLECQETFKKANFSPKILKINNLIFEGTSPRSP